MKIGVIGLGKLGLPISIAIDNKGHDVIGYDINPNITEDKKPKDIFSTLECDETGENTLKSMIDKSNVKFTKNLNYLILNSDIIFVAVQTPHDKLYEGSTRIPTTRKDFNYDYLVSSIKNISNELEIIKKEKIVTVISTVLPTTIRNYIIPVMSKYIKLCYNPFFIAMGTTVRDFYYPEFILLGVVDENAKNTVCEFYKTITTSKVYTTTLENAELIKVCYNTMISTKVSFVNTIMEMCDKLPNTNVDQVTDALKLSNRRLISPAYMTGGMGDGGGCHPRDNIALSWLSNKLNLSFNFFDAIMICRENQTEYFAKLIEEEHIKNNNLKVYILGKSFKPETNIISGSPSILLKNLLKERNINCIMYDPYIDTDIPNFEKGIYFIGTKHSAFKDFKFIKDSIVLDPHRYILNNNIILRQIGNRG